MGSSINDDIVSEINTWICEYNVSTLLSTSMSLHPHPVHMTKERERQIGTHWPVSGSYMRRGRIVRRGRPGGRAVGATLLVVGGATEGSFGKGVGTVGTGSADVSAGIGADVGTGVGTDGTDAGTGVSGVKSGCAMSGNAVLFLNTVGGVGDGGSCLADGLSRCCARDCPCVGATMCASKVGCATVITALKNDTRFVPLVWMVSRLILDEDSVSGAELRQRSGMGI